MLDDGHAHLQVGFGGGANVQGLAAAVFVFESGQGEGYKHLAYQANMGCNGLLCTDDNFKPVDGHAYKIYYVLQGQRGDIRFSDWDQTTLALEPAVYLSGLPAQLDLGQMPADGWPVELASSTLEKIGALSASIALHERETGAAAAGVSLDFVENVPETGTVQSKLYIKGLDTLRPGNYAGEIKLEARSPTGLPMNVRIRPAPVLSVTLSVARPVARLDGQSLDFGEVLFDTSPNFRLDQQTFLPVSFSGRPFKLTAHLQNSTCPDLSVTGGDAQQRDGKTVIPLRLNSTGPVQPSTCKGAVVLSGPDSDHDVIPAQVNWQIRVANVEWSLVSGDLALGDVQDAGARVRRDLLVRFNGKTPFVVQLAGLNATASNAAGEKDGTPPTISAAQVDMPPVEVDGAPNQSGLYEVPITLITRQAIPKDSLRGTFYSGQIKLNIAGLEGDTKSLNINFRSPSIMQRYIAPYVVPVYSLPWLLCTGPFTLLLLLVIVARMRSRGFNEDEIEQAAIAATMQMATPSGRNRETSDSPEPFAPVSSPQVEAMWGSSEWSSAWGSGGEANDAGASGRATNPTQNGKNGDPWSSSW